MGPVYIFLIFALSLLPMWVAYAIDRLTGAIEERRSGRRVARAWGLGLRRSGPWFWRVGGL